MSGMGEGIFILSTTPSLVMVLVYISRDSRSEISLNDLFKKIKEFDGEWKEQIICIEKYLNLKMGLDGRNFMTDTLERRNVRGNRIWFTSDT